LTHALCLSMSVGLSCCFEVFVLNICASKSYWPRAQSKSDKLAGCHWRTAHFMQRTLRSPNPSQGRSCKRIGAVTHVNPPKEPLAFFIKKLHRTRVSVWCLRRSCFSELFISQIFVAHWEAEINSLTSLFCQCLRDSPVWAGNSLMSLVGSGVGRGIEGQQLRRKHRLEVQPHWWWRGQGLFCSMASEKSNITPRNQERCQQNICFCFLLEGALPSPPCSPSCPIFAHKEKGTIYLLHIFAVSVWVFSKPWTKNFIEL